MASLLIKTLDPTNPLAGVTNCEEAKAIRPQLIELMTRTALCPEAPVEIDGERWDRSKYLRSLRESIKFTYEICELEAMDEGPYFGATQSKQCGKGCSCC